MTSNIHSTRNGVQIRDGHLFIPPGLPTVVEPEVDNIDSDHLDRIFLESRRLCFICGIKENLGVCIRVCPSHITDAERQKQSDESKAFNSSAVAAAAAASSSPASSSPAAAPVVDHYEPYAKNPPPTDSVPSLDSMRDQNLRLVVELVPCYVCVNCRRMGEAGSGDGVHPSFPSLSVRIPSPTQRGLINKYCQRTGFTLRFRDCDGAYWPITDRLIIFRSDSEAANCEINLFQQMALLATPWDFDILNTMKNSRDTRFQDTLAVYFRQTIPTLLRAASKLMVKGGKTECREMQAFEPTYEYSLVFIRAALHILQNYPQTRENLVRSVYRWAYNPFSRDAKELFQHWMDPLWTAALCGIPFSHIREPLCMCLFNQLALGYNPDDTNMEKLDVKTYLRRVFNEGRSRNACQEFLYTLAFSGMVFKEISTSGIHGVIALMNRNSCYLPQAKLIEVWREMSYVNDNIVSLIPEDKTPGLFRHLGLGDPNADSAQTIEHVFKFLNYARRYGLKMHDAPVPLSVINRICSTSFSMAAPIATSAVERHHALSKQEEERLARLSAIHEVPLPLNPNTGAHRLTELRCAYPGCGRVFPSGRTLRAHLEEAWRLRRDDPAFSLVELHRRACGDSSDIEFAGYKCGYPDHLDGQTTRCDMTPDLVMSQQLTQCPVKACPMHNRALTPTELCDHFASKGVRPFWTPGWEPRATSAAAAAAASPAAPEPTTEQHLASIFDNPGVCIICQDAACSVILMPCGHINMCDGCHDQWRTKHADCPTCRAHIDANSTFAVFMTSDDKDKVKVYLAGGVE